MTNNLELDTSDPRYSNVINILKHFNFIQGERVQWYQLFEETFQKYTSTEITYEQYQLDNHSLSLQSQQFKQQLKLMVNLLREKFKESNLANLLEKVSDLEFEKFKLTANLQINKIKSEKGLGDYSEEINTDSNRINSIKSEIFEICEEIQENLTDLQELD
ncbi:hypothetical protein CONCODRAFT_86816 [Conidiobolus coronatus NRRL 28638]|uniref:Uncharacterized protein n=1 Tax=Conidiobolus coronatus (strain ATCC 28846 / CBS 209.66 / NRRL 28638) TaxID=796925 RepID=A0A137NXU8_CONC2|nr:hypothetical protein CONCODRAFT_86816 [Conidiobolus coronatus NRRL 28638]|eukprot:KXN67693.1 hypothetical protein CONCODRAFT_86816 [Conidiobolus coronatus NRRL 28638]